MAVTSSKSFYVTLPSNSSLEEYPDNTLTSYRVKLPHTVLLDGTWEVGLVEIHYPHRWYNYLSEDEDSKVSYSLDGGESWTDYTMTSGYYSDIDDFLRRLVPNRLADKLKFTFDEVSQKVSIGIRDPYFAVKFTGTVASMLGFKDGEVLRTITGATYPIDMIRIHTLFVYSDLVEHQIVGNVRAPLLRTVTVKEKHGRDVSLIYEQPHYLPVNKKLFDTIEINIRDATGRKVPFQRGRVVVKLHFKKIAPSILD